jgi:hypothetical protein
MFPLFLTGNALEFLNELVTAVGDCNTVKRSGAECLGLRGVYCNETMKWDCCGRGRDRFLVKILEFSWVTAKNFIRHRRPKASIIKSLTS